MSKEYEIKRINYIFQIPEDKFDEFLVDFKAYYHFGRGFSSLVDTVAEATGVITKTAPQHMTWIDDGKHDAKIRFNTGHEETKTV